MAPSQLKQLKAALHAKKTAKGPKSAYSETNGQDSRKQPGPKQNGSKPLLDSRARADLLRRSTLLPALQNRNKVGGIVDRRIGENDPTMTPEERNLQRYARQRSKRADVFNLEDDGDAILTHGGRSLFDGGVDDFAEDDLGGEEEVMRNKRPIEDVLDEPQDDEPERKKTKKEVMEEVMAKSKFYKHERQQAKDEDDDVREKLDNELPDLLAILRGEKPKLKANRPEIHPDRMAQIENDRAKEYDQRLRQMAQDQRAKPTERTKTDEEKAAEDAQRLQELEEKRRKRMRGEGDSDSEQSQADHNDSDANEASAFGLKGIEDDDEDDFLIDDDLVASGSDQDTDFSDSDSIAADDDEEFLRQVRGNANDNTMEQPAEQASALPYTFPCPENHDQLLRLVKDTKTEELPLVIQRIRALHHPQLNSHNKDKMVNFMGALIDHLRHLSETKAPLKITENVVRHIHSLAKSYPDKASTKFREELREMTGDLSSSDLIILTAIGSIFPTSDHFHQVVTPAITIMARWLGTNAPDSPEQSLRGAYLIALCLKYQAVSKRFVPETVRFTTAALKSSLHQALHLDNMLAMVELWFEKSAFVQIFHPAAYHAVRATGNKRVLQRMRITISQATLRQRPLQLHNHRPLAIKTSVPKFEEGFHPDKHYDPDRERSEANRLRKEYKREHKGAVRELRKDAAFMHREKLKDKRERDADYERKQRRLIAEIQGEEGYEKNEYEREKKRRKGKR